MVFHTGFVTFVYILSNKTILFLLQGLMSIASDICRPKQFK